MKDTRFSILALTATISLLSGHRMATWARFFRNCKTKQVYRFSPPLYPPTSSTSSIQKSFTVKRGFTYNSLSTAAISFTRREWSRILANTRTFHSSFPIAILTPALLVSSFSSRAAPGLMMQLVILTRVSVLSTPNTKPRSRPHTTQSSPRRTSPVYFNSFVGHIHLGRRLIYCARHPVVQRYGFCDDRPLCSFDFSTYR